MLARLWLFVFRWKVVPPSQDVPPKCVLIAAPHTSNWDFPVTLAMAEVTGVRIEWLGKKSLFKPPFGWLMRALGGVEVDRSGSQGLVEALASEFSRRDSLVLVVPAEGTRSFTEYWKSGFYRIAERADVPVICAFVDKSTRSGGFGPPVTITGDVSADMDQIRAFYEGKVGLKPGREGRIMLRDEEDGAVSDGSTSS